MALAKRAEHELSGERSWAPARQRPPVPGAAPATAHAGDRAQRVARLALHDLPPADRAVSVSGLGASYSGVRRRERRHPGTRVAHMHAYQGLTEV